MMNISFSGIVLPPVTTGHPASLPPDQGQTNPARTVTPATSDALARGTGRQDEGEAPSTPPSAMQRRITEILEAQAEALKSRQSERDETGDADR